MDEERVLVVDGHNILMRAVKAVEGNKMQLSVDGVPTGPLLLFVNQLARRVSAVQPHRMVLCWDSGASTFRRGIYAAYKANRGVHEPDSVESHSWALAKEFLTLAGIHHVFIDGVEADDLIAHYWRTNEPGRKMTILSGDKDFFQLLDDDTTQIRPGSNLDDHWTAHRVETDIGCTPEHLPYVMALTGDSGDGVPGIPGFGNKTACKFLDAHDWNLEALLTSDDGRVKRKLDEQHDNVVRNLLLVNLRMASPENINLPPPPLFEPTDQSRVLWPELVDFLNRWQMATTKDRLIDGRLWSDSAPHEANRLDFSGA